MTKVGGSLGFTLRKADSSALGHYVRALVREPAISDGRIRPGDKIVAVDDAPLSPMSHEEAVALLRQCGPKVKLRLYRDLAQTPVSALSPTEPDYPPRPPRTSLRYSLQNTFHSKANILQKKYCFPSIISMAEVSNWNSIRENQRYSEPFRNLFPDQSEKCFVSCLMENGQKSIRLNPIHSASM